MAVTAPESYTPQLTGEQRDDADRLQLQRVLKNPLVDSVTFKVWYAPPEKPYVGMMVVADGTSWNPIGGVGAEVVIWNGTTWVTV